MICNYLVLGVIKTWVGMMDIVFPILISYITDHIAVQELNILKQSHTAPITGSTSFSLTLQGIFSTLDVSW